MVVDFEIIGPKFFRDTPHLCMFKNFKKTVRRYTVETTPKSFRKRAFENGGKNA